MPFEIPGLISSSSLLVGKDLGFLFIHILPSAFGPQPTSVGLTLESHDCELQPFLPLLAPSTLLLP